MKESTSSSRAVDLLASSVDDVHGQMVAHGLHRAFVICRQGVVSSSHPSLLAGVERFLLASPDYADHEAIFIGRADDVPTLFLACVHDTHRGLSQGGVRTLSYPSFGAALVDGLRLSHGMTRKNALADLWWGGGKGVIPQTDALVEGGFLEHGSPLRRRLFERYGSFVASLGGVYYMAEDVGTTTADMDAALARNRFTTCVSQAVGGSGNPSAYTARGVLRGIEAGWQVLRGERDLLGVKVAVQGLGHVGAALVQELLGAGAEVWATDTDQAAVRRAADRFPEIEIVDSAEIYGLAVDVFAPCAVGAVVNPSTIELMQVSLVCGAANNMLGSPEDADLLEQKGIAYVPDFLCNRMGITNCCDEPWGHLEEDVAQAAEKVFPDTLEVFAFASENGCTTSRAADQLADRKARELHPIHGHRGRRLIDHLVASGWHDGGEDGGLEGVAPGWATSQSRQGAWVQDGSISR